MDNYENFQPRDEEDKQWVDHYNNVSNYIYEKIRGLNEKDRLPGLEDINPIDLSLIKLYLQALKNEDYETCSLANKILIKSGFKTPN